MLGGSSNFGPPGLTFVNNGRPNSIILGTSVLGIWVDAGTQWNATSILPGSGTLERCVGNITDGVFSSQENLTLPYYHENLVAVGFSIKGGGIGYSPPELQASALNSSVREMLSLNPASLWLNTGAQWRVSSILNGTTATQRWVSQNLEGIVSESEILPIYYRQSLVSLSYSILGNSTGFVPPQVNWTSFGLPNSSVLNSYRSAWMDYGSVYSFPNVIDGKIGERWIATSEPNVTISSQLSVSTMYQTQYLVNIVQPREGGGTILSAPSGWYDQSQNIALMSEGDPGWKLGAWSGTGAGSYSGNSSSATLTVDAPILETALYYPALTISSGQGGKVSYSYDDKTGLVSNGKNVTLFVPPLTEVDLVASSPSTLELFNNWHGAISSPSDSILLQVRSPEVIVASFGFNYPLTLLSVGALVTALLLVVVSVYRRRKEK